MLLTCRILALFPSYPAANGQLDLKCLSQIRTRLKNTDLGSIHIKKGRSKRKNQEKTLICICIFTVLRQKKLAQPCISILLDFCVWFCLWIDDQIKAVIRSAFKYYCKNGMLQSIFLHNPCQYIIHNFVTWSCNYCSIISVGYTQDLFERWSKYRALSSVNLRVYYGYTIWKLVFH